MATYAEPVAERRLETTRRRGEVVVSDNLRALVPLGRALFAAIFLAAVPGHFTAAYVSYAAEAGVPMAGILVPLFGLIALGGGLSILLGFHARFGGWLVIAFLLPITFSMHNFWAVADPTMRAFQQAQFMKNIAMIGAALLIAYWGAGPISVDAARLRRA